MLLVGDHVSGAFYILRSIVYTAVINVTASNLLFPYFFCESQPRFVITIGYRHIVTLSCYFVGCERVRESYTSMMNFV